VLFCYPTGGEHRIDHRMGASFCQVQAAHLGKGTLVLAAAQARRPDRALAAVSTTSSSVLSMAMGRRPKRRAPLPCSLLTIGRQTR